MAYARELAAVWRWLADTDAVALRHFRVGVHTETKADGTPVTVADRAIEAHLREQIARDFPGDAILGEEQGGGDAVGRDDGRALSGADAAGRNDGRSAGTGQAPRRRWVIDPIDGTKNYARGVDAFATLIALEEDGRGVLGVVSAPALGRRWWATRGGGAFRSGAGLVLDQPATPPAPSTPAATIGPLPAGQAIAVSPSTDLRHSDVMTGGLDWAFRRDRGEGLARLLGAARRQRGFGDFWGHLLVAQGSAEVMVEWAPLAPWDVAAVRVIVEEAGGRWTGLEGGDGSSGPVLSATPGVFDAALALARPRI